MSETLKEKTAKGIFWGGLSHGVQQLLNLIFGLFLARILDISDYGMVGMLTVFSAIAGSLQESGFIAALVNKKEVTHKDYNAVFWFSILMGGGLYLILFLSAPLIANFYEEPDLIPLSRFLFLSFVASSFGIAHRAILFRNLKTKETAITSIIALVLSGTIAVILACNGMGYWGIAIQTVIFSTVISLCYWYFSKWRPTFTFDFKPLRTLFGFSNKLLITNIFLQINNNLFAVLLGKFYFATEVGSYTQANKWNAMGHSFITGTIQGVAQPVLSKVNDDRARQCNVFRKMLRFTAFISFPAMLGLSLISEEFIIITITDKWLTAVPILQILCFDGAFIPIIRLYSNLIISKGRSNVFMWNTLILCLVQLIVMWQLRIYGVQTMVAVYVGINICWLLVWHYFVWREIRLSLWDALKDILPFFIIAAITMAATYYLTSRIDNLYFLLIARIAIAAILYTGILKLFRANILNESIDFLLKRNKPDKT